jgi:hypothetical protein
MLASRHIALLQISTSHWREHKAGQYPEYRTANVNAAARLLELSMNAEIAKEDWPLFEVHYSDQNRWREAVSLTNRQVCFTRQPRSFSEYMGCLLENLTGGAQ